MARPKITPGELTAAERQDIQRDRLSAQATIRHFKDAIEAYVMIGAQHPGDHAEIERRYIQAKGLMMRHLMDGKKAQRELRQLRTKEGN